MERLFFREEQKFRKPWVWIILLVLSVSLFTVSSKLLDAVQSESDLVTKLSLTLIINLLIIVLLFWLFLKMKLVLEIRKDGVWYMFPPLKRKWKTFRVDEIESFQIRKYNPIMEYGGWGIKGKAENKAYNVSGNIGLQLFLKNGKRVLFGTQRNKAIKAAMDKIIKTSTS